MMSTGSFYAHIVKLTRAGCSLFASISLLLVFLPLCAVAQTTHPLASTSWHLSELHLQWSRRHRQDSQGYYDQPTGICEDYTSNTRTQTQLDQDFKIIRWTGAKALRVGISWLEIETEPGQYNWTFWDELVDTAARNKIALLPYVCYTPDWATISGSAGWRRPPDPAQFAQFMKVIATRYRGRVYSWELWNEPDNRYFWHGTVDQFAQLALAGAAAVRQADPHAVVVLGGMSDAYKPFLQTLIQKYRLDQVVDVINFHGYYQTWNSHPIEDYTDYINGVARKLTGPSPPDIWMAEFGYSDLRPTDPLNSNAPLFYQYEHTAGYQASMLFKTHILDLATGALSLTAWYRLRDLTPETGVIGDDNNKFFGITNIDGTLKPAAYALRFYIRLLDHPTRCIDRAVDVRTSPGTQSELHVFEQHGRLIIVGWLRSTLPGELRDQSGNARDVRSEIVSVKLPSGAGDNITVYNVAGGQVSPQVKLTGSTLTGIKLDGQNIFIATLPLHGDEINIDRLLRNP